MSTADLSIEPSSEALLKNIRQCGRAHAPQLRPIHPLDVVVWRLRIVDNTDHLHAVTILQFYYPGL